MFPRIFTCDLNANLRRTIFSADIKIFLGTWLEAMDFISILDINISEFLLSDHLPRSSPYSKGNQYVLPQTRICLKSMKSLECLNALL